MLASPGLKEHLIMRHCMYVICAKGARTQEDCACILQPPRTSEDTGVHAERDPRRNGMDNPYGAGYEPLHPQLALLTGKPFS